jgi:starch-binding outer membrane protein, SusD/RagB family
MRTLNIRGIALARAVLLGSTMALATLGTACKDSLLNAPDPDLITPSDLDTPEGASALRIGALQRWRFATGGDNTNGQESTWLTGGLLADEWGTSSTFVQNDELDERSVKLDNATVTFDFRKLERVRTAVDQAIPAMQKWRPTETVNIAELYLARGNAEMQLASDFCNGIPLSDASTATSPTDVKYSDPLKVVEVFQTAIKSLDSGYALLVGVDTASDVGRAIKVTKARALLGIDAQANAAAAAALMNGIPTNWKYQHTYAASSGSNALWGQPNSSRRYNVGDSLEGNAHDILVANNIPFFSSKDPRVPSKYTISTKGDTTKSQDGLIFSRTTSLWSQESPVDVANGIDARLIEAEAQFIGSNYSGANGTLAILNALRSSSQILTNNVTVAANALPQLTDPGTDSARVAQLFREKAFWTFSRGERLGDLRRLIRQAPYSQWFNANNTFPTGTHYRGGTYGPDVNLPVPKDEENNNPKFHGCLDRNA